jgi:flagellar biosynthesis protein FlhB
VSDKTEEPTPRRLRKAREEGDSGASAYASQAVGFTVAVALVPSFAVALGAWASGAVRSALSAAAAPGLVALRFDPVDLATSIVALTLPVLVAASLAGAVVHAVQTGGVVAAKRLSPDFTRLDPFAGLRGLFAPARLFAVVRALAAAAAVAWLAVHVLEDHLVDLARTTSRPSWIGVVVGDLSRWLAWRAAVVGLALGVVDLVFTRHAWRRKLRMSKEETKREHRDAEGDPQVKAARERAYHDLLAQAAAANVRGASVVVVNPIHIACALRYERAGDAEAPVVLAVGEGDFAARIVRAARDHGVPVVRDVPLARALVDLAPGDVIPESLYEAVAEVLRSVWEPPADAS